MSSIMNISGSSIYGNCNNKCSYSFNYPNASITARNNGNMIQMTYNNSPSSQVVFNSTTYNVTSFGIITPSSHKYNGSLVDAELFIQHSPVGSGELLFVYIPVSLNGINNSGSDFLSQVINSVSTSAPSLGNSTTNGIKEFSLNKVIPMTSYYNYKDKSNNNNIVFDLKNAINIQNNLLTILKKVIKSWTNSVASGPEIFINTKSPIFGTENSNGNNDIYIDCQPTDASDETVSIKNSGPVNSIKNDITIKSIVSNPFFIIIVSLIIFVLLFFGTQKLMNYLNPKSKK